MYTSLIHIIAHRHYCGKYSILYRLIMSFDVIYNDVKQTIILSIWMNRTRNNKYLNVKYMNASKQYLPKRLKVIIIENETLFTRMYIPRHECEWTWICKCYKRTFCNAPKNMQYKLDCHCDVFYNMKPLANRTYQVISCCNTMLIYSAICSFLIFCVCHTYN